MLFRSNAETWNGRVAQVCLLSITNRGCDNSLARTHLRILSFYCSIVQMAFTFVFLQELIFGKGVVQGLTESDPIFIACAVLFFVSVGGLGLFLAIKGPDNYVDRDLGRK